MERYRVLYNTDYNILIKRNKRLNLPYNRPFLKKLAELWLEKIWVESRQVRRLATVKLTFLVPLFQSVLDAQWLAYQVQMYYASESSQREEILKTFNVFPDKFDHMTVVNELSAEIESGVLKGLPKD